MFFPNHLKLFSSGQQMHTYSHMRSSVREQTEREFETYWHVVIIQWISDAYVHMCVGGCVRQGS